MSLSPEKIAALRARYAAHGQDQVFAHWDSLTPGQQQSLAAEAEGIDLVELDRLVAGLVKAPEESGTKFTDVEPPHYIRLPEHGGDPAAWSDARQKGEAALRAGRVAAFTVAGGQGTRLGFDGPKGSFPVTPVLGKPLFQVFAEKILAASRRYGKAVPWFIMTSPMNHAATTEFFAAHGFFGLAKDQVAFFQQGSMPAVDDAGRILLAEPHAIALSPDGHGGSLRALVRSGAVARMKSSGIDLISYFQVDNPMVRCLDPAFIGFHLTHHSEMSSKIVLKRSADEKVGVFAEVGGRLGVLEYSDLPKELSEARGAGGELLYRAGSIAIHLFSRDFVTRSGGASAESALPFHRARKKVPFVQAEGLVVNPAEPNAWKFEMFVFDALPQAENPIVVETSRADEFSPVKNADGADSPHTCRDDQLRQYARWIQAVGGELACDATGRPEFPLEVSPLFGDDSRSFEESWHSQPQPPGLESGSVLG